LEFKHTPLPDKALRDGFLFLLLVVFVIIIVNILPTHNNAGNLQTLGISHNVVFASFPLLLLQEEDGACALVTHEMSSFLHSLLAADKVL
jgi:hypothetical protein